MAEYGYLNRGKIIGQDPVTGGYLMESVGLARTSKWGPSPSCVPGLKKGDKVILASAGTSRDDVIIIAKIDAAFAGIPDIEGLLEALHSKASAAQFDSLSDYVATLDDAFGDLDGRTTSLEGRATSLEGRATLIEGVNDDQDDALTALDGRLDVLEPIAAARPYNQGDRDLYGDLISTVPRHAATSLVTLPAGVGCLYRTYGNRVFNYGSFRASVGVAGTGPGTVTCSIYVGVDPSNLILYSNLGISLAAVGEAVALLSGVTFAGFPHMAIGLRASGFTVYPQVACTPVVPHPSLLSPTAQYAAASKTIAAWPATVNLSDGTWSALSSRMWLALNAT